MKLVQHVRAAEGRQLVVVGGKRDSVPGCTLPLGDGDTLCVGSTTLRVLETPCHTRGHVLFCILSGPAASAGSGGAGGGGGPLSLQRRNASAAAACDQGGNHAAAPAAGCCGIGAAAVAAAAPGALPSARDADVEAVFSGTLLAQCIMRHPHACHACTLTPICTRRRHGVCGRRWRFLPRRCVGHGAQFERAHGRPA